MTRKVKRNSSTSVRTAQQSKRAKTPKPIFRKTANPTANALPKITTDEALWKRLLTQIDFAVMTHVQGYSPSPRPRTTDPGWEDLLELQKQVATKVQHLP